MTNKINDQRETRIRIGKIIKEARLKKDLTQAELGKKLGKSNNVITNWEKGTNSPDVDNIEILCAILDIPVNYMFDQQSTENEKSPILELVKDEQHLITAYRKLSHDNKIKITGIIEFMFDEESATKEEYEDKIKRA